MKLYNKGERSFIVKVSDLISGDARPVKDELSRDKGYIGPGTEVEVTKDCGENLLVMYPKELIELDKKVKKSAKVKKE